MELVAEMVDLGLAGMSFVEDMTAEDQLKIKKNCTCYPRTFKTIIEIVSPMELLSTLLKFSKLKNIYTPKTSLYTILMRM